MVLSCQIQSPAISLPQNGPNAHEKKAGWLSEPVYIFWKGKIYLASTGNRTTIPWFLASSLVIYLYQSCRTKIATQKDFLWYMAFHIYVCIYVCIYIYIYTHTQTHTPVYWLYMNYRCYQITMGVKLFKKIGSVAKLWLDIYLSVAGLTVVRRIRDIEQNVLQISLQTGSSSSPSYSHMSFLIAFLEEEFIRDIKIVPCIYYNMP
jgi:hypothetical protein